MSVGHRVMLTVAIAVAMLLALATCGYMGGRWEDAGAQEIRSQYESRLVELDHQALEQAYLEQMTHVFSVWVKDGVSDPSRARVGFANARKGYVAAMEAIEKRKRQ